VKKFLKSFFMCLLIIPLMFSFSACKKKKPQGENPSNPVDPAPGPDNPGGDETSSKYTINVDFNLPSQYSTLFKNYTDTGEKTTGYALPSFKNTNLDEYFEGWFYTNNNKEIPNGVINGVNDKNVSVYAKWKDDDMLVSYYTDGLKFDVKDDVAYISGCNGQTETIIIPSIYTSNDIVYKIIGIKDKAFENNINLKNVLISPSIEDFSVGSNAFSGSSLKNFDVSRVTSVSDYAFANSKLESVKIGNNITTLSDYMFADCKNLTKIELSNSVTSIGSYAFKNCVGLSDLSFLNSQNLNQINDFAFDGCMTLTNLDLPNNILNLGLKVFNNCLNLQKITIYNNFCYQVNDGEKFVDRFGNLENVLREITFADGVIKIPANYFENFVRLNKVVISDSVESIEGNCFYNCTNLNDFQISQNSNIINFNCSALAETAWMKTNNEMLIRNNVLLVVPSGVGEQVIVPENVIKISSYSFTYNTSVKKISLPSNLENIDRYAFYNNKNINEVNFGSNSKLNKISDYAFYGCENLSVINLENCSHLTEIGRYAFFGLSKNSNTIESFALPNTITNLGKSVFSNANIKKFDIIGEGSNYIYVDSYGVLYLFANGIVDTLYSYPYASEIEEYHAVNTISKIEYDAFNSVENLKVLYINNENSNVIINKGSFDNTNFIVLSDSPNIEVYSNCYTSIYFKLDAQKDIDFNIINSYESVTIELSEDFVNTLLDSEIYYWFVNVEHNSSNYCFLIELNYDGSGYNVKKL